MICPVHGAPGDSWPCPDECPHFQAELERRVEDVTVNGNFTRLSVQNGVMCRQRYRNHEPVGERTIVRQWSVKSSNEKETQ